MAFTEKPFINIGLK